MKIISFPCCTPPAVTSPSTEGVFFNFVAAMLLLLPCSVMADEWTKADTVRETAYIMLHIADWNQTRDIARNPDQYYEVNPILGEHPSVKRVDSYMAFSMLAHIGIAYVLPRKWREGYQYTTLGGKAGLVFHNNRIGLSASFK